MTESDYSKAKITKVKFPDSVSIGTLWRRRWVFRAQLAFGEPIFPPPLVEEACEAGLVVAMWSQEGVGLIVDTYTDARVVTPSELAYVSSMTIWIKFLHPDTDLVIDGMNINSLLAHCRLSVDTLNEWRRLM